MSQSDKTGSERLKRYRACTVILVQKRNSKIGTVISIPKLTKWNGYISSDKITGTVIFDPVKLLEQFYLFQMKTWNSFISSDGKSGIVIFVPKDL